MSKLKSPSDYGIIDDPSGGCFNHDCEGHNNCTGCPKATAYNLLQLTEVVKNK